MRSATRAKRVSFRDRDEWYSRPAKVIAGYDQTLRFHLGAGAPRVRVVGEVQFGSTPDEWDEWTVYEALLNRAFARPRGVDRVPVRRPHAARRGGARRRAHASPGAHGRLAREPALRRPGGARALAHARAGAAAGAALGAARHRTPRSFRERLRREMAADGSPGGADPATCCSPRPRSPPTSPVTATGRAACASAASASASCASCPIADRASTTRTPGISRRTHEGGRRRAVGRATGHMAARPAVVAERLDSAALGLRVSPRPGRTYGPPYLPSGGIPAAAAAGPVEYSRYRCCRARSTGS